MPLNVQYKTGGNAKEYATNRGETLKSIIADQDTTVEAGDNSVIVSDNFSYCCAIVFYWENGQGKMYHFSVNQQKDKTACGNLAMLDPEPDEGFVFGLTHLTGAEASDDQLKIVHDNSLAGYVEDKRGKEFKSIYYKPSTKEVIIFT